MLHGCEAFWGIPRLGTERLDERLASIRVRRCDMGKQDKLLPIASESGTPRELRGEELVRLRQVRGTCRRLKNGRVFGG